MASTIEAPTKACHNCRRQRLRCDRSYPQCNKCLTAGKECLGYGQFFRWTGAVASRGKLAGQTSSASVSNVPKPKKGPRQPACAVKAQHNVTIKRSDSSSGGSEWDEEVGINVDGDATGRGHMQLQLVPWNSPHSAARELKLQAPRVLIDPVFQDMSQPYRYYLSYFLDRLCKDLVSYDLPEQNPFRTLVPLTRAHPLLQHVVVAASAAHMSNLMQPKLLTSPESSPPSELPPASMEASQRALRDSLVAKHKALQLMHTALRDIEGETGDVVLAAALFFVNVELIESGKHGWRAHLDGAGKIISMLQPNDERNAALRDYLLSDFFIYFILGCALMPAKSAKQSNFETSQIRHILQRATPNSYLCCPPEILEILYSASQLSNVEENGEGPIVDVASAGAELLRHAQSVDIPAWAETIHSIDKFATISIESRIQAGSAHRVAACLYILQAIPSVAALVDENITSELNMKLFAHLSSIPDEDPNFKATTWPTFIAGAGARDQGVRDWTMDRLQRLVLHCPWGFLYTAMEALQAIWNLDGEVAEDNNWVQTLKNSGQEFLIV